LQPELNARRFRNIAHATGIYKAQTAEILTVPFLSEKFSQQEKENRI